MKSGGFVGKTFDEGDGLRIIKNEKPIHKPEMARKGQPTF
jgi:hypothetical protein